MKNKNLPALVQLAIVTLITTLIWVGFEVYRAFSREPEPAVSPLVLQQLDPTLDQIALDRLVNRIQLGDAEIGDTVLTQSLSNIVEEVNEETDIVEEVQATESGQN